MTIIDVECWWFWAKDYGKWGPVWMVKVRDGVPSGGANEHSSGTLLNRNRQESRREVEQRWEGWMARSMRNWSHRGRSQWSRQPGWSLEQGARVEPAEQRAKVGQGAKVARKPGQSRVPERSREPGSVTAFGQDWREEVFKTSVCVRNKGDREHWELRGECCWCLGRSWRGYFRRKRFCNRSCHLTPNLTLRKECYLPSKAFMIL